MEVLVSSRFVRFLHPTSELRPVLHSNLKWARVEVGDNGDSYPFEVDDILYDPGSSPIGSDGLRILGH